ncbi:MAG TPA: LysE family transporter [Polyangiaceae bacterium]|jgi:threonine/homoserine/homoserine lactone efflux protein
MMRVREVMVGNYPFAFVAGFAMAFFGSMPPVGPIAVLLLERGVSGRDQEGRQIAHGAAIAETIYCALAMAGVSELMSRYPVVETGARVVGVVILIVLGVHFARLKIKPPETHVDAPRGKPFVLGFTISAANPVLIITWSGSIATLLSFSRVELDVAQRAVFVLAVFLGMLGWFHLFLWMLRRWRDRITLRAAQGAVRVAGVAMIAIALWGARLFFLR